MNAVASLKGNLGLRSSPLSPTASKLSTQYLVLDHMSNHYKKISKAKSAIDSKPPKSMMVSQKARDTKRRKNIERYGRSQSCASLCRNTPTRNQYFSDDENLLDESEDEEDRLVHSIMRTTLQREAAIDDTNNHHNMKKTLQYHQDLHHSNAMATTMKPMLFRQGQATQSLSNISRLSEVSRARKPVADGDILSKRADAFTEPRPFTPRTLKTNRQSKLSQSKCYTPPKQKRGQLSARENQSKPIIQGQQPNKPKAKPRNVTQTFKPEMSLNDSNMFETLQSRDFDRYTDPSVPPLDITVDKDNLLWLKEQAERAQNAKRVKKDETLSEEDF